MEVRIAVGPWDPPAFSAAFRTPIFGRERISMDSSTLASSTTRLAKRKALDRR